MCFHGPERVTIVSEGGTVVRMIIVMEVRKTSSVIVDPIRYKEPTLFQRVASFLLGSRL